MGVRLQAWLTEGRDKCPAATFFSRGHLKGRRNSHCTPSPTALGQFPFLATLKVGWGGHADMDPILSPKENPSEHLSVVVPHDLSSWGRGSAYLKVQRILRYSWAWESWPRGAGPALPEAIPHDTSVADPPPPQPGGGWG